ncbi:MAG: hypothetical protein WDA42_03650 [Candidatus Bathyarchaeia archaeon]
MATINDLMGVPFSEVLKLKHIEFEGVKFPCQDVGGCLHVMAQGGKTVDFIDNEPSAPLKHLTLTHLELSMFGELGS